jgi:hypothetical protein
VPADVGAQDVFFLEVHFRVGGQGWVADVPSHVDPDHVDRPAFDLRKAAEIFPMIPSDRS